MIQTLLLGRFGPIVAEIERSWLLSPPLTPFDPRLFTGVTGHDAVPRLFDEPEWYRQICWDGRELDKSVCDRVIRAFPRVLASRALESEKSQSAYANVDGRWILYDPAFTCHEQFGVETGLLDEADCPGWLFWCSVYPSRYDMWKGENAASGLKLLSYIPARLLNRLPNDLATYSVCGALRWIEDVHTLALEELQDALALSHG